MASTSLWRKCTLFTTRHPLLKGMLSYAVFWPIGSALQQVIEGNTMSAFDWKRCLRFSIHGAFVVAPVLYGWIRLTSAMWPGTNLKNALIKAALDQASHGPMTMSIFFIGMNLWEFKSLDDGIVEWKQKFLPSWKVSVWVWPLIHTINFSLVPERNRVVFVSIASVLWTTFLAYMKQISLQRVKSTELNSGMRDDK